MKGLFEQKKLTSFEEDRAVVLVEAGQSQLAGVGVEWKLTVVDGTDEFYLRVKDVDDF